MKLAALANIHGNACLYAVLPDMATLGIECDAEEWTL